jgi:hypothetical protein
MTRKERLMRTLRGEPVDRPAFNFYEINGTEPVNDPHPFNIYSDPSWKPLIDLAAERTDRIVMRDMPFRRKPTQAAQWTPQIETRTDRRIDEDGNEITVQTVRAGHRTLTQRTRRAPDINTVWTTEHLLKDVDDFKAWLDLPQTPSDLEVDPQPILDLEAKLGDSGIVMLDTADPLCCVAPLFEMGEYTVIAMTEPDLMHRALQRQAAVLYPRVEAVARALPGRLWRIYGPEYASPPYLPTAEFEKKIARALREGPGGRGFVLMPPVPMAANCPAWPWPTTRPWSGWPRGRHERGLT